MNTAVNTTAPFGLMPENTEPAHESAALIKPGYDPRLTNEDLAPLRKQTRAVPKALTP